MVQSSSTNWLALLHFHQKNTLKRILYTSFVFSKYFWIIAKFDSEVMTLFFRRQYSGLQTSYESPMSLWYHLKGLLFLLNRRSCLIKLQTRLIYSWVHIVCGRPTLFACPQVFLPHLHYRDQFFIT